VLKLIRSVSVRQAKADLPELLKQVERGGEVVIARNGKPVARLVPVRAAGLVPFRVDTWRERIQISPDFDTALTERELSEWGGRRS